MMRNAWIMWLSRSTMDVCNGSDGACLKCYSIFTIISVTRSQLLGW
jgi:hypothetical protein